MKILLIEDSRLLRVAIGRMLSKAGYEVTTAGDGQVGLLQAHESHPDVVLLDMMLPTLEGTSVLRMLKKNPLTKHIPVIVLSGLSQKNERRLKHDGAAGFLQKSVLDLDGDGAPLIAAMESLLPDSAEGPNVGAMTTASKCGA